MPDKINLCLQYWEGDFSRAMRTARFFADVEKERRRNIELTFVARFDAPQPDPDTVRYTSKKFDSVNVLRGTRKSTGWPDGCNDLALDLLQQSAVRYRTEIWNHFKAIYLLESDIVPLSRDWLTQIEAEWDFALRNGKLVLGAWCPFHSPVGHINGNMLVTPDLVSRVSGLERCPAKKGWDAYLAPQLAPHWQKSRIMQNHYDYRQNIPEEILWSSVDGVSEPVVVHGVKDFSAERQVRERLGL